MFILTRSTKKCSINFCIFFKELITEQTTFVKEYFNSNSLAKLKLKIFWPYTFLNDKGEYTLSELPIHSFFVLYSKQS